MNSEFKFDLRADVTIKISQLPGTVIGRAEYARANPSYLVTYADRSGRLVEDWISEEHLDPVEDDNL